METEEDSWLGVGNVGGLLYSTTAYVSRAT